MYVPYEKSPMRSNFCRGNFSPRQSSRYGTTRGQKTRTAPSGNETTKAARAMQNQRAFQTERPLTRKCVATPAANGNAVFGPVSYTHLRAHETPEHLVCRLLLEKKK